MVVGSSAFLSLVPAGHFPYAGSTKILLASSFAYPGLLAWQAMADTAISSIQGHQHAVGLLSRANARPHPPSGRLLVVSRYLNFIKYLTSLADLPTPVRPEHVEGSRISVLRHAQDERRERTFCSLCGYKARG